MRKMKIMNDIKDKSSLKRYRYNKQKKPNYIVKSLGA